MSDFNLDTVDDGGYTPVVVTYKGKDYTLGEAAFGLMRAPAILELGEGEKLTGETILLKLPDLLKALGPKLHEAIEENPEPLKVNEELMLINAITEVLNRFGRFRVTAGEDES